jgi:CheY-like chemotaxis protein
MWAAVMYPELGWGSPSMGCSDAAKPRVLIVDCEPVVRTLLQNMLQIGGFETLSASSAREALTLWRDRSAPIDVVVTEINLPGMSGLELADSLSAVQPNVRILLISGYLEEVISAEIFSGPNRAFLAKPFVRAALAEKLSQLMAPSSS